MLTDISDQLASFPLLECKVLPLQTRSRAKQLDEPHSGKMPEGIPQTTNLNSELKKNVATDSESSSSKDIIEAEESSDDEYQAEDGKKESSGKTKDHNSKAKSLRKNRDRYLMHIISNAEAEQIYEKLRHLPEHLKKSKKRNWSEDETKLFFFAVAKHTKERGISENELTPKDWAVIHKLVPGRTAEQCEYKWSMARKIRNKKAIWTEEENSALIDIVNKQGPQSWKIIATELNNRKVSSHRRKAKQCRERWFNFLCPNIKKETWNKEEDIELLELTRSFGKKWAQIARDMPGRTENSVKNRFNSLIRKEKKLTAREKSSKIIHADFRVAVDEIEENMEEETNKDYEKRLQDSMIARLKSENLGKRKSSSTEEAEFKTNDESACREATSFEEFKTPILPAPVNNELEQLPGFYFVYRLACVSTNTQNKIVCTPSPSQVEGLLVAASCRT